MPTIQRVKCGGTRIDAGRREGAPGYPHPCSALISAQRRNETFEQGNQPLAGHSDSGDNGQGDEPGDEAVFDGGGAGLVAQKFSEHAFPSNFAGMLVARSSCRKDNQKRKIAIY